MSGKRLWRVEAIIDGSVWRRDYQSKQAASERAQRLLAGSAGPEDFGYFRAPASRVRIFRSEPIEWEPEAVSDDCP